MTKLNFFMLLFLIPMTGCLLAAAGVGAEAAYVATQEERTVPETIGDQAIVTSVKAKLVADSFVPGFAINVDSHKGVVRLKGIVDSLEQVERALDIARGTSGVRRVINRLIVAPQ